MKQDPERRAGFMKYELDLMDAKREARKEGQNLATNNAIKEFVINFKDLGLNEQDIQQRLMKSFNLSSAEAKQALQSNKSIHK